MNEGIQWAVEIPIPENQIEYWEAQAEKYRDPWVGVNTDYQLLVATSQDLELLRKFTTDALKIIHARSRNDGTGNRIK